MMKNYYPNVIATLSKGSKPSWIGSYDSCFTIEEARNAIQFRRKEFECLCAWIDDGEGHVIEFENYVDCFGTVDHVCRYTAKQDEEVRT